jgi:hypothetical protein
MPVMIDTKIPDSRFLDPEKQYWVRSWGLYLVRLEAKLYLGAQTKIILLKLVYNTYLRSNIKTGIEHTVLLLSKQHHDKA